MTGIVAVHCGAGHHSIKYSAEYRKVCKRACKRSIEILKSGGSALEAAKEAVKILEDFPLLNAGRGSNLTSEGFVEMDASIMDGKTLTFGACGAVKKVKNPITLAYDLCTNQLKPLPLGLTPPSLLVGSGALQYAKTAGLKIVNNRRLVTARALKQFRKYKNMYQQCTNNRLDTVGAVCIDSSGNVAAACSSGGILLKKPGRVGQGAIYSSGVWADSFDDTSHSIAVCTTGCGEHLVQTQLAKTVADRLKDSKTPPQDLHKVMTEDFMKSKFLRNVNSKFGGCLALHNNNGEVSVLWAHSTQTMCVGYMSTDKPSKSILSILPKEASEGQMVSVSGACFYIDTKRHCDNYLVLLD